MAFPRFLCLKLEARLAQRQRAALLQSLGTAFCKNVPATALLFWLSCRRTTTYNIHEISTRAGVAAKSSQALFFVHPARESTGIGAFSPLLQLNGGILAGMRVWAFTVSDGRRARHVLSHFSAACPALRRRQCRCLGSGCAVTSHQQPPASSPVCQPQISSAPLPGSKQLGRQPRARDSVDGSSWLPEQGNRLHERFILQHA